MAGNQEKIIQEVTPTEREIPVFTVLKNNCILKNIFLLDSPPAISPASSSLSVAENADHESEEEEILTVGRHPDCNIKLEHPSISRFHLRIHSKPSSRSLSVTDLSSVHGTWISGKKVEPGMIVKLNESDTLRLGASSRLYKLSWVPISYAYNLDRPFVPELGVGDIVKEETEEAINQDENVLPGQVQILSDDMEGLQLPFSDDGFDSSMQKGCPASSSLVSQDSCNFLSDVDEIKINSSGITRLENDISNSEPCGFDKENGTPPAHSPLAMSEKVALLEATEASGMNSVKRSGMSIWSRRGKPENVSITTDQSHGSHARTTDMSLQIRSLDDENHKSKLVHKDHLPITYQNEQISTAIHGKASPDSLVVGSLNQVNKKSVKSESVMKFPISSMEQDEEEIFTPDKENVTPNAHLQRSMKNRVELEEVKNLVPYRSSPLKEANNSDMYYKDPLLPALDKESQNLHVLQERKPANPTAKSNCSMKKQPTVFTRAGRDPFGPLPVNTTTKDRISLKPSVEELNTAGRRSITYPKTDVVNHSHRKTMKAEHSRWIIVVDSTCLLNKNSRKELQLLQGLRGTTLVIPRIVVRELDCMLRRVNFFTRKTEVSAALQWIEECMVVAKWWIHVQSSVEEGSLIPPTPPASSPHSFTEDKTGAFFVGSNPFSRYSLQEIVTPAATDHVLECALFHKRIRNDGQLVLLTDDVTLKIKAMSEGVICETAEEFRRSLVNPFSKRFLYADSSPVGHSWSCVDDVVLKDKYYPSPSKKFSKSGEGVKGLKLILHHNSNFRQAPPAVSFTQL